MCVHIIIIIVMNNNSSSHGRIYLHCRNSSNNLFEMYHPFSSISFFSVLQIGHVCVLSTDTFWKQNSNDFSHLIGLKTIRFHAFWMEISHKNPMCLILWLGFWRKYILPFTLHSKIIICDVFTSVYECTNMHNVVNPRFLLIWIQYWYTLMTIFPHHNALQELQSSDLSWSNRPLLSLLTFV